MLKRIYVEIAQDLPMRNTKIYKLKESEDSDRTVALIIKKQRSKSKIFKTKPSYLN